MSQAESACYPVKALEEIPEAFRAFFKARGVGASRHVAVSEERAVNAAAFDLEYTPAEEPDVEMFQADPR